MTRPAAFPIGMYLFFSQTRHGSICQEILVPVVGVITIAVRLRKKAYLCRMQDIDFQNIVTSDKDFTELSS
ncbi:hypothetical protein, partial [Xanthocytophaga flava]|uniref:hypothetical protein n=1 Tax=Xanthocytophaga flava TaxID=3048013 RepID=UPI0028D140A2